MDKRSIKYSKTATGYWFWLLLYFFTSLKTDSAVSKCNRGSTDIVLNGQKLIGNGCLGSCRFVIEKEGISAV